MQNKTVLLPLTFLFLLCSCSEQQELSNFEFEKIINSKEFKDNQSLLKEKQTFVLENPNTMSNYIYYLESNCPETRRNMDIKDFCNYLEGNPCLTDTKIKKLIEINCDIINNSFSIKEKFNLSNEQYLDLIIKYQNTKKLPTNEIS